MKRGFTLVELLIVLVIMSVVIVMIMPTFNAGSGIVRVKTASRGLMQMSRYARTMALLHQTPLDLVFTSDGQVSVAPVGGGSEGLVSASAFGVTNGAALAAAAEKEADASDAAAAPAAAAPEKTSRGGGASYVMADLDIAKKYEQVSFMFEGYTDTLGEKAAAEENETDEKETDVQTFRVRYKSNGTCRPYKIKISAADGDEGYAVTVVIDMLGVAKIEEDE